MNEEVYEYYEVESEEGDSARRSDLARCLAWLGDVPGKVYKVSQELVYMQDASSGECAECTCSHCQDRRRQGLL